MEYDRTLPSITESEAVEDMKVDENDEVHENSSTSSDRDENSEANHGEEEMIGVQRGMRIGNDEDSVQLEQVKQRIIILSTGLEFVAGYYAYRGIRSRKLSWRRKAIRFFPMFIIPAAAYFFYSLFSRKLKLEEGRSERVTRQIRKSHKNNHGESSSRTSIGSNLPEVQIMDENVNPSPSQVANEPVAMDLVRDINQLPDECVQSAHSLNCHGESSSMASSPRSNHSEVPHVTNETANPNTSQVADKPVTMDLIVGNNQLPEHYMTLVSPTAPNDSCPSFVVSHAYQSADSLGESSSIASSSGSDLPVVSHSNDVTMIINAYQSIDSLGESSSMASSSGSDLPVISHSNDVTMLINAHQSTDSRGESSSMASSLGLDLPVVSHANDGKSSSMASSSGSDLPVVSHANDGESSSMVASSGLNLPVVSHAGDETMDLNLSQVANEPIAMDMLRELPEECISLVISFTTPRDACVCSAVSHYFQSASNTDATWERFLPPDCDTILARAVNPVEFTSRRELYFRLCDQPVLINIDGVIMSFGLERPSGAKCFMISARGLSITWGDDSRYWNWISLPGSRFSEVAELIDVCWLEIHGYIDSGILTEHTAYVAYLIFKMRKNRRGGLGVALQETSVTIGGAVGQHLVCLHPDEREQRNYRGYVEPEAIMETEEDVNVPRERGDGWMEIELGGFNSGDGFDGNVIMSLREIRGNHWKYGLIVHGIEVRPTH